MSNLIVSYVSQTPAGIPPGATTAAPATDSPLGFLTALIDQLLAGTGAPATGPTEAGTTANLPGLLTFDFGQATEIAADTPKLASNLLASLVDRLDALQSSAGPSPQALPQLRDALDALIGRLDAVVATPQATIAASAPAETQVTAQPQALLQSPAQAQTQPPTISDAEITALLSRLGLVEAQAESESKPAIATADAKPSPDITALRDRLTALAHSIAATAPDIAQKLTTLVQKLEPIAANPALAAELGFAPPASDPDAPAIAHIVRTLLGHGQAKDAAPRTDTGPASQAQSDLLQILATLGTSAPPSGDAAANAAVAAPSPAALNAAAPSSASPPSATSALAAAQTPAAGSIATATTATAPITTAAPAATASPGATTAVPAPLLRLANQLSQVAAELAGSTPELAKKIEAVATRLVSADADPNLLARLTDAAAQPDRTTLDRLVQNLIEGKPTATPQPVTTTPQIAAPSGLPTPALIAPTKSKSAVAEVRAAPPEPAPVAADSAPKPAQNVTLAATAQQPASDPAPELKAEAKGTAAVSDAAKADPAAQPPATPAQPAPVAAQHARPLPAAYQPVANPINMGQVAFEMVRQVHQGTSRFTIRLDPPELGRVDVKMHVDNTGTVNARLTVDRAETLDLFQRDRQALERALTQAGLDAGKTNLEFSLRQQNHNPFAGMMGGEQRQQQPGYGTAARSLSSVEEAAAMPAVTLYRGTASAGGVNIFA